MAIFTGAGVAIITPMKENGDVDYEAAGRHAAFATPVPGGVGTVTTSCLLMNTIKSAEQK